MSLSAVLIEEKYGSVLRQPPYNSLATARLLYRKLEELMPGVKFSEQALKTWIQKYRGAAAAVLTGEGKWSAFTLEAHHGPKLRESPFAEASTARQLFRLLEEHFPTAQIPEGVVKSWPNCAD